ncbi:hypothetical protein CHS0354_028166 [Potamilus streckersoni]|uniref:Uncharacterized protein n=1 Tax=Potamilus streckersoni TaxID=2493646 RepID=A0AAE0TI56_9BIVA|nr:hypothetical protein CHS0354_028166 [Potamilus streckersoni]
MPSMHGESAQCCLCFVGVFLFLGGVLMLATGISLILNYGVSRDILLPTVQSEEDKRIVGIALTCFGAVCMAISILVSIIYLCSKTKSNSRVAPDNISQAPSTNRKVSTPDPSRLPSASKAKPQHVTNVPGSATISQRTKTKKKKRHLRTRGNFVGKLAGIQEADSVSRKAVEGSTNDPDEYSVSNERSRSGSVSSAMTADDGKPRKDYLPNLHNRSSMQSRQSLDSASTFDDSFYSQMFEKTLPASKVTDKALRTNNFNQSNHGAHGVQTRQGTNTASFQNEAFEDDTTATNGNTLSANKLMINQGHLGIVTSPLEQYVTVTSSVGDMGESHSRNNLNDSWAPLTKIPYLGNNENEASVTEDSVNRLTIPSWGQEDSGFQVQTPHSDTLSLI